MARDTTTTGRSIRRHRPAGSEAASTLGISVKTIETHRLNVMRKLRLRSVSDLVRYAIRNEIVQP